MSAARAAESSAIAVTLTHPGTVWDVAFTRDGKRLATSAHGREEVIVWDAATGKAVATVRAAFGIPNRLADRPVPGRVRLGFSFDGAKLFTVNDASGAAGPIRAWDAAAGTLLWEKPVAAKFTPEMTVTRHGVFVTPDEKPTLLDAATGKVLWANPKNRIAVFPVVSPDGGRVAFEAGPVETTVLDAATGKEIDRFPGVATAFAPGGRVVAFAPDNYSVRHRFLGTKGESKGVYVDREGAVIVLSPDTRLAAVTNNDGGEFGYRIVDARDGTTLAKCPRPGSSESDAYKSDTDFVGFSPDGRTLAVVYRGIVVLWEAATGARLAHYTHTHGEAKVVAFAPDSRTLFTSHAGKTGPVFGWDLTCGAWRPRPRPAADEVRKLTADLGGPAAAARRAVYRLAAAPDAAVAWAKAATRVPTAADLAEYKRWVAALDAPAFADREAARKKLAEAGWRAEPVVRAALRETTSTEVRERIEELLAKPDARPVRAVHLLELVGTSEALAALRNLAAGPDEALAVREAKRTLDRLR